jgi:cell wall-associated NlpC family hydrolase
MSDRTGQFGVVRTQGFVPQVIRLMTRSQVNHAYVYVTNDTIVEAEGHGAQHSRASKYDGALKAESGYDLDAGEKAAIRKAAEQLVGTPYGFLDIAAIALRVLGLKWKLLARRVERTDRLICSQLVDRAYANAGVHLYDDGRLDGQVTPGDLLLLLAQDPWIKVDLGEKVRRGDVQ